MTEDDLGEGDIGKCLSDVENPEEEEAIELEKLSNC